MPHGIGAPVRRVEDARLLTGRGVYCDDVTAAGQASACSVRSVHAHAHAELSGIGATVARAMPGVLAVLTAAECALEIAHAAVPNDLLDPTIPALESRTGTPPFLSGQRVFAERRVRFVGDVVAMVVAETPAQARGGRGDRSRLRAAAGSGRGGGRARRGRADIDERRRKIAKRSASVIAHSSRRIRKCRTRS